MNVHELLTEHGLTAEDGPALAQLFRQKIEVGDPHYSDVHPGNLSKRVNYIELEVGFASDSAGGLDVFERLMADFGFQKSCGLARVFKLRAEEDYSRFMTRLHTILLLGWRARWELPAVHFRPHSPPPHFLHHTLPLQKNIPVNIASSLAMLFRKKLQLGEAFDSTIQPGDSSKYVNFIELEVAFKDARQSDLEVFDALMADFLFDRPRESLRVFKLGTAEDHARFTTRIQLILNLGWHASWHTPRGQG
jgi:hypothetical protein